jgi:hypothetical protein
MNVATNDSSKLSGIARYKIPNGNIFKLPITSHMSTKPINQENKVVCNKVNFFAKTKMAIAKQSDHTPQIAPLIGSEGNINPRAL